MEFSNLVDLIQVFANEYCFPESLVLLILPSDTKLNDNLKGGISIY